MHGASGYATGAPNAIRDYLPEHIAHNARHGPSVNYESDNAPPDRFESFLLGAGEKKITSQVDTRKSAEYDLTAIATLLTLLDDRYAQHCHLHFEQGRPYPRQSSQISPPSKPKRLVLWLQGMTTHRRCFGLC